MQERLDERIRANHVPGGIGHPGVIRALRATQRPGSIRWFPVKLTVGLTGTFLGRNCRWNCSTVITAGLDINRSLPIAFSTIGNKSLSTSTTTQIAPSRKVGSVGSSTTVQELG